MSTAKTGTSHFGQLAMCEKPLLKIYSTWDNGRMKSNPKMSPEYTNFENAMRAILRAPKSEVNRVLAEEKAERAQKPKRGPKPHPR
jgi:uncharacterized protein YgiM (DUF1202 family)